MECKICGAIIEENENFCTVNEGFEDEFCECNLCHDERLESCETEICDCCGNYFTHNHMEINPKNGIKELCPYCHQVWCE